MGNFHIDLAYLVGDWVEAVLWGIYTVLFCVCMRCIWVKRRTELFHFTTITIVTMYICATVHIALACRRLIEGFIIYRDELDPQLYFANISIHLNVVKDFFYVCMMVLGDTIIVWRCFIVWNRNYWVVSLPLLMLTSTIVGGLGAVAEYFLPNADPIIANKWAEAMFVTSLITNISVTCLTAGRIWYRSRVSTQFFASGKGGYTAVLLLVIESALVISIVKAIEFALWLTAPDDGLNGMNGLYILYEAVVQVEGMVPATMILAVTLGYTSRKTYAIDTTPTLAFRPGNVTSTSALGTDSFQLNDVRTQHDATSSQEGKVTSDKEIGKFNTVV